MSQVDLKELEDAHHDILQALAARGIQISDVTITALAIVLVEVCVEHKVGKKLFLAHLKDTWRRAVTAKQNRERDLIKNGRSFDGNPDSSSKTETSSEQSSEAKEEHQ
jgi:hypothetical protein